MRRMVLLLVVNLLLITSLVAQSPNGSISGIVHDPSGAVIVGAEIIVVNDATGVQSSTTTNSEGIYVVPNLLPGAYRLQVSKIGFKTLIKPDILLHVQDALAINFTLPIGAASETVTVQGGAPLVNTQSGAVSTVIDRQFVENLPLNGRSFNTLLQLTPGVVIAPISGGSPGQFSMNGQRTDANNFQIDGVSANFGVLPTLLLGSSGVGQAQAFSALGGTSSLISVDDLQEFRVETSSFAPEFGQTPGGQVILSTRAGTNELHGGIYDYFRNDILDANNWFANAAGKPRAAERHNDFGGFLGGPVVRDRTFVFFSYEGAQLRTPQTQIVQVPSASARASAPAPLAPFLNAYPEPNGAISSNGETARFTGSYSNQATLDAASIRIDHTLNSRFSVFGRYNYAPSRTVSRINSLSDLDTIDVSTQTATLGVDMLLSSRVSNTLRANYSKQDAGLSFRLDSFGGAVPLPPNLLLGSLSDADNLAIFATFDTGFYFLGPDARNQATQMNFVDGLAIDTGRHQVKFGGDYRAIYLNENPFRHQLEFTASNVQGFLAAGQANLSAGTTVPAHALAHSFSLYGQDTWNATRRLALTYGVRWELDPAPSPRGGTTMAAWVNTGDPSAIGLAPLGTPLWSTVYTNFAPRIGIAYRLARKNDLVLRGGWGLFYDLGAGSSADALNTFPNVAVGAFTGVSLPVTDVNPFLPPISLQPPYPGVEAFLPDLKLPRSYQWNIALEQSLGGKQVLSATYVGQAGRDLLRREDMVTPNPNFSSFFLLTGNTARSDYNALQLQFRRPLADRLQALVNYTWSHSLDNSSNDALDFVSNAIIPNQHDRGSSDFDIRHSFSAALTYYVPGLSASGVLAAFTKGWCIAPVIVARSGFPFNSSVLSFTVGNARTRPDVVPGLPFWLDNSNAPGGKSLNQAAFSIPSTFRQGTEGRNDIPGFGLTEVDVSFGRKFPLTDRVGVHFRVDAFNLLNHPNFTNPRAFVGSSPTFLQSNQMLNQGLGGLNPLFQEGGPRSLQLSLKLTF